MKKHLVAAAVIAAVSVPAMAQNVTVYGIVDLGQQNLDTGTSSFTKGARGVLGTNRIGMRGSEDLGGGLKANFTLQSQIGADAAAGAFAGASEEAWVGLSGGFGEIRVGVTDVTGIQGFDSTVSGMGNIANTPTIGYATAADGRTSGSAAASATSLASAEKGVDQANVVRYISPRVNGFQLDVGYTSGNASSAQSDGNGAQSGAFVNYSSGPLTAGAGMHTVDGAGVAKTDFQAVGARYDFGMLSIGAIAGRGDASVASDTSDISYSVLSVNAPLGSGLVAHASFARAKIQNSAIKGKGYTAALTKAMSKRTTVYGVYTSNTAEGTTLFSYGGVPASAAGADQKAITVGISHTF